MIKKHSTRIINYYLPAALFTFCFVFRFIFIDTRDISIDEPFSIFHAQQDLNHIFNLSTQGEPNTPLFLILLHFWIKLFGYNATFLRILPLLFNSLTVLVIYQTGKRFFHYKYAITASLLFILSFSHFFHGLEVRSYSMFTLAVSLSLYSFFDLINGSSKGSVVRLVLSNLFVVYSHYFGWFIILSEAIGILLYLNNRKALIKLTSSIFLTVIGFAPMIKIMVKQFYHSSKGTWLSSPSSSDYKKELLFLFNHQSVLVAILMILIAGLLLYLFRYFKYREWKLDDYRNYITLLLWSLIPYTLMFFISSKIPVFTGRYILYTAPGFYLLVTTAIGLLLNKNRILEVLALSMVVILMAFNLRILPHDFGWRDIKKTAAYITESEKELHKRAILVYPAWVDLEFIYHYNPELFKEYNGFDSICREKGIRKAWSIKQIMEFSKYYLKNDIILLTNTGKEETEKAFAILDSTHMSIKKDKFPEFYNVGIYKARD